MDKFWKALSRLFRTKLVWWIVGLLFIGFLLWLLVPSFTPLANAFGWILTNLSKICNFLLVVAGAACAIRPRKMAEIEQNPRRLRLLGISLFVVATTAFISDLYNSSQIDSQIRQLSSSGQTTVDEVRQLKTEMGNLARETREGFGKVVDAINALRAKSGTGKPLIPTEKPKIQEPKKPIEPPIVEHIRFTQRRVAAPEGKGPYATQVIIQTDVPSQPTSLRIESTGPIDRESSFFIAGQPVMMNVRTTLQGNVFTISFGYPAFSPENPIVVTLLSKEPIEISKVEKLPGF